MDHGRDPCLAHGAVNILGIGKMPNFPFILNLLEINAQIADVPIGKRAVLRDIVVTALDVPDPLCCLSVPGDFDDRRCNRQSLQLTDAKDRRVVLIRKLRGKHLLQEF